MKSSFYATSLVLLTVLVTGPWVAQPPNVVVLLADDAGWGDYSFNGNQQVATPHIDSIARQGAVLDRFYVCPVCSPTRAEFLTGRYHLRGGVIGVSTGQERLDVDESTIADAFRAAGYATGAFGKWHNGSQWPYHPLADAGSLVELGFHSAALQGPVQPGWDPPLNTDQDTLPRPAAESQLKPFRPLALGTIELPAGRGDLTLRALQIPGHNVMDVRRLTLTLLAE